MKTFPKSAQVQERDRENERGNKKFTIRKNKATDQYNNITDAQKK